MTEGAECDPDVVWRVLKEMEKRQTIFEEGQNQAWARSRKGGAERNNKAGEKPQSGHSDGRVPQKEPGASSRRKGVFPGNCYGCNQPGHTRKECPLRGDKQKTGERRGNQQSSQKAAGRGVQKPISVRPVVTKSPEKGVTEMDTDDKEEMIVMPKWRAIELGAKPAQENAGRTVTRVEAQVSQHQQYAPPPELHTVPVSLHGKQHEPGPDYNEGKGLVRYSRIKVLEPGGKGGARVEKLEPHVKMLSGVVDGARRKSGA